MPPSSFLPDAAPLTHDTVRRLASGARPVNARGQITGSEFDLMRRSDFFSGMDEAACLHLLEQCRLRSVPPERTLFYQDDPACSFFVVLSGWVKVTKLTESGALMVRRVAREGGTLAEAAVFSTGLYPGTAESLSEARILEVPLDQVVAALGGRGSLAFNMVLGMAKQAERTAGKLEQAFHFTAPQRLAAFLLGLFPSDAMMGATALPYDKCLLALSLGMTPETLSRAFVALREVGVRTRNRQVVVDDLGRLRGYCGVEGG